MSIITIIALIIGGLALISFRNEERDDIFSSNRYKGNIGKYSNINGIDYDKYDFSDLDSTSFDYSAPFEYSSTIDFDSTIIDFDSTTNNFDNMNNEYMHDHQEYDHSLHDPYQNPGMDIVVDESYFGIDHGLGIANPDHNDSYDSFDDFDTGMDNSFGMDNDLSMGNDFGCGGMDSFNNF